MCSLPDSSVQHRSSPMTSRIHSNTRVSLVRSNLWDLLHNDEQLQVINGDLSAADAAKRLVQRRAAQVGCAIHELPEGDDWDIGLALKDSKVKTELRKTPGTCAICTKCAFWPFAMR